MSSSHMSKSELKEFVKSKRRAVDESKKKFSGPLGNDTWESDFNIEDFMSSSKMGITDTYMKSPKRNRPKF